MRTIGEPWPELNDGIVYSDRVRSSESGLTLIKYYSTKYKSSAPLQGWLQRIENGQITVDRTIVMDPGKVLCAASELQYHRLPWREPDAPYLLGVLFEDDHLIALNKPSGLQVLPGGLFQQRTVLTQLQWYASKQSSLFACQETNPAPVHRLGRGTSGILLCAKTKLAKARISAYFANGTSVVGSTRIEDVDISKTRKISKTYRALASGILLENEVIIKQPIGMLQYPGVAKGLYVASPSGKLALSKVCVLERDIQYNRTLVEVEIQSGRPHQIRIHLSFIGHPLIGDPLYVPGGRPQCYDPESVENSFAQDGGYQRPLNPVPGDCGYYLHAHRLVFSHPLTDKVTEIIAPLPSILQTQEESKEIEQPSSVQDVKYQFGPRGPLEGSCSTVL